MNFPNQKRDSDLEEKYSRLRDLINNKYKIQDLLIQYDDSVKKFPKRILSVLNVNDNDPSMFINYRKNVWHCFSTGKGGGYLELVYWLKVIREKEEINKMVLANQLLLSDRELQQEFGALSLFKKQLPSVMEPVLRSNTISRKTSMSLPAIFKDLARRDDKGLFYTAISDYEAGVSVEQLIDKYGLYKSTKIVTSETRSLEDLITNIFGGDGGLAK